MSRPKPYITYESNGVCVDTCFVGDGRQPFETMVEHPSYHEGNGVIVQSYDTWEEALEGHRKWVDSMTGDALPDYLRDCSNSVFSMISEMIEEENVIFRKKG